MNGMRLEAQAIPSRNYFTLDSGTARPVTVLRLFSLSGEELILNLGEGGGIEGGKEYLDVGAICVREIEGPLKEQSRRGEFLWLGWRSGLVGTIMWSGSGVSFRGDGELILFLHVARGMSWRNFFFMFLPSGYQKNPFLFRISQATSVWSATSPMVPCSSTSPAAQLKSRARMVWSWRPAPSPSPNPLA